MKALGMDCTPGEIIDAMEEVVGEEGTLLMPALTYENVNAEQPIFDSAATEPCIRLLPRVFLHRPGVERIEEILAYLDIRKRKAPVGQWVPD